MYIHTNICMYIKVAEIKEKNINKYQQICYNKAEILF